MRYLKVMLFWVWVGVTALPLHSAPPFSGTIFIDPDIITESDPTTFQELADAGRGNRTMYDRRIPGWTTQNAFLFDATYSDGLEIEIQVNPEFGDAATARIQAAKYAPVIGRLPKALRLDLETVWIHRGNNPFGGGNNNLLIHTDQGDAYLASGILEETFVHEASHTSLDSYHANAPGWLVAQSSDPEFISTYARDNPTREDIAETFLVYLAVRYRSDRISNTLADTITQAVPNRIAYFDSLAMDMTPITTPQPLVITGFAYDRTAAVMDLTWLSNPTEVYTLYASRELRGWVPFLQNIQSQGMTTRLRLSNVVSRSQSYFKVLVQE